MKNPNGEWISVQDELPSKDGIYEITNHPEKEDDWCKHNMTGTAFYDGYGFEYLGIYRNPLFWRKYTVTEKKYGKIKVEIHDN